MQMMSYLIVSAGPCMHEILVNELFSDMQQLAFSQPLLARCAGSSENIRLIRLKVRQVK